MEDAELGFGEIRDLTKHAETLSQNQPYFALSDARAGVRVTPLGKKTSADPATAPLCKGSAVLVSSKMLQIAANFYDHINPAPHPFKAFTSKQAAIKWLLSL